MNPDNMEIKDFEKEYNDLGAYHYNLRGFKEKWFDRNYRMLSDKISGKILDVACGDGRLADYVQKSALIDGFDIVNKALKYAENKNKYRNLWIGDIKDPENYLKDRYDYIVCSLSLQYLTKTELLEHINFISEHIKDSGSEYRFSFPNNDKVYSPEKLKNILKSLFKVVEFNTITGIIENADSLLENELDSAFESAKHVSVEKSYHYTVKLFNRQKK